MFEAVTEYAANTYKDLYVFVFDRNRMIELKDNQRIPTGFNNEEYAEQKADIIDAAWTWKIDPRRPREIAIDYKVSRAGSVEQTRVVWTREGNRLVRKGEVPRVLLEEPDK